ncbi:hypothetical protein F4703DRAFT_1790171 [Phycomyces blakesleeanus]
MSWKHDSMDIICSQKLKVSYENGCIWHSSGDKIQKKNVIGFWCRFLWCCEIDKTIIQVIMPPDPFLSHLLVFGFDERINSDPLRVVFTLRKLFLLVFVTIQIHVVRWLDYMPDIVNLPVLVVNREHCLIEVMDFTLLNFGVYTIAMFTRNLDQLDQIRDLHQSTVKIILSRYNFSMFSIHKSIFLFVIFAVADIPSI